MSAVALWLVVVLAVGVGAPLVLYLLVSEETANQRQMDRGTAEKTVRRDRDDDGSRSRR